MSRMKMMDRVIEIIKAAAAAFDAPPESFEFTDEYGNEWTYVLERTCEITFKRGAMYDVARYSCCGYEYPELVSETDVAENYCPNCGARVVEQ